MTAVFYIPHKDWKWECYEDMDLSLRAAGKRVTRIKDQVGWITLNDILGMMDLSPIRQGLTLGYFKATAVCITWTPKHKEDAIILKISNLVDISSALPEGDVS